MEAPNRLQNYATPSSFSPATPKHNFSHWNQLILALTQKVENLQNRASYVEILNLFSPLEDQFKNNNWDDQNFLIDLNNLSKLLTVTCKACYQADENYLRATSNVSPVSTAAGFSPFKNSHLMTKLNAIYSISKLIYNFIDMKDQNIDMSYADYLTSFYLNCLDCFSVFLVAEQSEEGEPSSESSSLHDQEHLKNLKKATLLKLEHIVNALATIVHENGNMISPDNINKLLSRESDDGVLIKYLHYFSKKSMPNKVEFKSSSDSIFGVTTVESDDSTYQLVNSQTVCDSENFSLIPKMAVMVLYCLCVKNSRVNLPSEEDANLPMALEGNWLRKLCISRIRESFRLYYLNYGKFKKVKEISKKHASYLLTVSRGLMISISNIQQDDKTLSQFEVKQLLQVIRFLFSLGLNNAPKNDSKMENEVSQPIPDIASNMLKSEIGNQKFKGKLPYHKTRFRKANKKKQISKNSNNFSSTTSDSDFPGNSQYLARSEDNALEVPSEVASSTVKLLENRARAKLKFTDMLSTTSDAESQISASDSETLPGNFQNSKSPINSDLSPRSKEKQSLGCHKTFTERKSTGKLLTHCRENALDALYFMVKILPKKDMLDFREDFLALENNITEDPGEKINLFTTLWLDGSVRHRIKACLILSEFCINSSKFLTGIANEVCKTNLTTMSINLASRLRFTILGLVNLIDRENHYNVKIELVKCLYKVVQNVPFSKLKPGLALIILNQACKPLFTCLDSVSGNLPEKSSKLLEQAILLLTSLFKISPSIEEIKNLRGISYE